MSNREKRRRYKELMAKGDAVTSEELTERVRLFYELHPEYQYWRDTDPDLEPKDKWPLEKDNKSS